MLILPLRSLLLRWIRSLLADEPPQLSLPDKGFNFLLQVVAISGVMAVIMVEAAVFVSRPFIRISLQLAEKGQSSFVFNLHQDLVDRGSQWGNFMNFPTGGLERLSSHRSPILAIFRPLFDCMSSCLSVFLGFSLRANNVFFALMYLVAL